MWQDDVIIIKLKKSKLFPIANWLILLLLLPLPLPCGPWLLPAADRQCSDGNLFIFANKDSILFDYKTNKVVKNFPRMPGGARNYPTSGSSAMLPLLASDGFQKIEILICGGAPNNAFT